MSSSPPFLCLLLSLSLPVSACLTLYLSLFLSLSCVICLLAQLCIVCLDKDSLQTHYVTRQCYYRLYTHINIATIQYYTILRFTAFTVYTTVTLPVLLVDFTRLSHMIWTVILPHTVYSVYKI